MRYLLIGAAALVVLHWCSPAAATPPSTEATAIMAKAAPKIMRVCPGLTKYATDMQGQGVEDNLAYAANRHPVELVFAVAENPARIPGEFRASGNTCGYSVSRDGRELAISKSACAMVCFDRTLTRAEDQASEITVAL